MAPRRLERAVPRWSRWSGCALALLAAAGCGDAQVGAPVDAQQSAWSLPELSPLSAPVVVVEAPREATPPPVVLWALPQPAVAEAPTASTPILPTSEAAPPIVEVAATPSEPMLLAPRELTAADVPPDTALAGVPDHAMGTAQAEADRADRTPEAYPPSPDAWASTFHEPAGDVVAPADESVTPTTSALLSDATPVTTGEPTGAMVCQRAQEKIRRAYELAERGAYFAARGELIDVLRTLADAKDQKQRVTRRAAMLASGLRALDEAGDFSPHGPSADAELNIAVIVSSHRTPVGKAPDAAQLMPQQLADLYLRYAQRQLGEAVSGEPAGSMALHALGKIYDQLGRVEPQRQQLADRRSFALQQAALVARSDNYLAAHELGVLLAESGHFAEAQILLSQVAAREPNPVVLRNLAQVERKLGREAAAVANERQAQFYASRAGAPSTSGVSWVAPQALAQTSDGMPPARRMAANGPQPGVPVSPQYRR